jgi:hypothetical protein
LAVTSISIFIRPVERRHRHQRRGRADGAEELAEDWKHPVRIGNVGEVVGCPHHVGERKTRFLEHARDGGEPVARLRLHRLWHRHGGVVVPGSAGHEHEVAIDDGAAVAGDPLERRAAGDETASHAVPLFFNA